MPLGPPKPSTAGLVLCETIDQRVAEISISGCDLHIRFRLEIFISVATAPYRNGSFFRTSMSKPAIPSYRRSTHLGYNAPSQAANMNNINPGIT
jgi:hypothetical protein